MAVTQTAEPSPPVGTAKARSCVRDATLHSAGGAWSLLNATTKRPSPTAASAVGSQPRAVVTVSETARVEELLTRG